MDEHQYDEQYKEEVVVVAAVARRGGEAVRAQQCQHLSEGSCFCCHFVIFLHPFGPEASGSEPGSGRVGWRAWYRVCLDRWRRRKRRELTLKDKNEMCL